MIKIENAITPSGEQWKTIILSMRNPMNSWDKSDSEWVDILDDKADEKDWCDYTEDDVFILGDNDLKLMKALRNAGKDHRKYLRYITVYVDITAPLYWWKEFKTYRKDRKFVDDEDFYDYDDYEIEEFIEMNSCSTMHKIHSKEFTMDDFSHEHLFNDYEDDDSCVYYNDEYVNTPTEVLEWIIDCLNHYRKKFIETKDKKYWWYMIQLLPSSYNQKRTVMLNYEVLLRMYKSRKNHKLDEWRDYCKWIEELPYAKELITGEHHE